MFKIVLINLPFASIRQMSLGLMQLKGVIDSKYGGSVSTRVEYLNQDCAIRLGTDLYQKIALADYIAPESLRHGQMSGLGEWFFRKAAFPDAPDNTDEYFEHYSSIILHKEGARVELLSSFRDRLLRERDQIVDFMDELITRYELDKADLLGMTSMFAQNNACFAMARLLKSRPSPPRVVMGGANCESPMGEAIINNIPEIDAVFSGPALKSFPAYVEACISGNIGSIGALSGVFMRRSAPPEASRTAAGLHLNQRPLGDELDINTPIEIDYASFLDRFYQNFGNSQFRPILTFETSRGCWWGTKAHCTFCGLNGSTMSYRAMTPANALALFEHLFQYGDRCSLFQCVDNIMPTNYPMEVFSQIRAPVKVPIFYEVKADLSDEDLRSMARAGVRVVQPGIESLSTPTLKLMKKGTTAFVNLTFLIRCVMHDIIPIWNLLIGFPGEDAAATIYAKYEEDLPCLTHLYPPTAVYPLRYDRFSPYFTRPREYGLTLKPMDFYGFVYPFKPQTLSEMAYHFFDANDKASYISVTAEWCERLRIIVERWRRRWDDADRREWPALFLKEEGESSVVYDSRSGVAESCVLNDWQQMTLRQLVRPTRISEVDKMLSERGHQDPASVIQFLENKRFLFREGDRVMSVICPEEPAWRKDRTSGCDDDRR